MQTEAAPRVDINFERICFPLTTEDFEALRDQILEHGCREPLVVWDEEDVLLDGHHRLRICQEHGIEWRAVRYSFPNRRAAHDWVIRNQLARRNVTGPQASYLRGKLFNERKADPESTLKRGHQDAQPGRHGDVPVGRTSDAIAAETGVSARTVERDGRRADSIDRIAESAGPDAREAILHGEVRILAKDLDALADMEPQSLAEVQAFADERSASRRTKLRDRRASNGREPWGQFSVLEVFTAEDAEGTYITARKLSCGHTVPAVRRVAYVEGRGTKSANCPTCKPGTRTPHDERQFERAIERSLDRAWKDSAQRPMVVDLVIAALHATSFGPHPDARAQRELERISALGASLRLGEEEE